MMNGQQVQPKKNFFKKMDAFLAPFVRGVLKSVPIAGPAIELGQNIRAEIIGQAKKHSYISIVIQATVVGCILYAFFTHQLTADQVIEMLNKIAASFE